ncbi:hypothetical protein KY334_02720 [Candidatus Woesearchaeota archaeon]|nr:hypothetical protein [Candidatus Woesearchaeota archaeon]
MAILGPLWLTKHIRIISLIISAGTLVVFSDMINRYVIFPVADYAKGATKKRLKKHGNFAVYAGETVATLIFFLFCYLIGIVVAYYIFEPILFKSKNYLIIILIGIFILFSYIINVERKRFLSIPVK